MSGYLPNHQRAITSSMDPRVTPSAKFPKSNMGPFPGGVSYLTPKIFNKVNNTPGFRTNGRIATTILSRSRDQSKVNVNQLLFLDFAKHVRGSTGLMSEPTAPVVIDQMESPGLVNLQSLNYMLADSVPRLFEDVKKNKSKYVKSFEPNLKINTTRPKDPPMNLVDVEKAYILRRFKLHGIVENKDPSQPANIESNARAITCTVRGMTDIYDYWSNSKSRIGPYHKCFLVLKKIKITRDMRFQDSLHAMVHKSGAGPSVGFWDTYQWQVLPYHCHGNTIPVSEYTWTEDDGKEYIGHYWEIGHIHEYPDIGAEGLFKSRMNYSVSQDITYMHANGNVKPVQFYLKLDEGTKMF